MTANYGILDFLEVGAYTGYSSITTVMSESDSTARYVSGISIIFYGISTNIHLMPFLVKSEKFRIDLYVSSKLGGFYRCSSEDMYPKRGHVFDYGVYAGTAFYLGKHWGFFGEYGLGNYTSHRVGLSFKF
jgi:hypothetical protein